MRKLGWQRLREEDFRSQKLTLRPPVPLTRRDATLPMNYPISRSAPHPSLSPSDGERILPTNSSRFAPLNRGGMSSIDSPSFRSEISDTDGTRPYRPHKGSARRRSQSAATGRGGNASLPASRQGSSGGVNVLPASCRKITFPAREAEGSAGRMPAARCQHSLGLPFTTWVIPYPLPPIYPMRGEGGVKGSDNGRYMGELRFRASTLQGLQKLDGLRETGA